MTNENELIRRGFVASAIQEHVNDDYDRAQMSRAIAALPAVAASQPSDPVVKADSGQRVTVKPAKTAKGNNPPASVWVTLHSLKPDGGETFIFSVTDHPWDDDCDATTTKWADNLEYVLKGTTIDTQPDPRDAVIARLVEALTEVRKKAIGLRGDQAYREFARYAEKKTRTVLAAAKGGAA
jgi:hypothetical protein